MNHKGVSYIFIMFVMGVIFIFALTLTTMALSENRLSLDADDRSKAFYMAEAGIYYAMGVIRQNPDPIQVPASIVVPEDSSHIGPFYDAGNIDNGYAKQHGFLLSIIYDGSGTYNVNSIGKYNGKEAELQASIPADGSAINNLQQVADKNLQ